MLKSFDLIVQVAKAAAAEMSQAAPSPRQLPTVPSVWGENNGDWATDVTGVTPTEPSSPPDTSSFPTLPAASTNAANKPGGDPEVIASPSATDLPSLPAGWGPSPGDSIQKQDATAHSVGQMAQDKINQGAGQEDGDAKDKAAPPKATNMFIHPAELKHGRYSFP